LEKTSEKAQKKSIKNVIFRQDFTEKGKKIQKNRLRRHGLGSYR